MLVSFSLLLDSYTCMKIPQYILKYRMKSKHRRSTESTRHFQHRRFDTFRRISFYIMDEYRWGLRFHATLCLVSQSRVSITHCIDQPCSE